MKMKEIDEINILTLQDNFIELTGAQGNAVVQRALPIKDNVLSLSLLAEHGFSALVTVTSGNESHSLLFDFGFSDNGAATNADSLNVDYTTIEALALSHGHMDHFGGFEQLVSRIAKPNLPLILSPACFRTPRYIKITEEFKIFFPSFDKQQVEKAGVDLVETSEPHPLFDNSLLFLGEIPRKTEFETGVPNMFYQKNDGEEWDDIIDDSALVANVKDKGLVILTGCAHSGIINTVRYAQETTGVDRIHAVMGGFHLADVDRDTVLIPTIDKLKDIAPRYIIPTHCTGRASAALIEKEIPDSFLLNMVGTKLVFSV